MKCFTYLWPVKTSIFLDVHVWHVFGCKVEPGQSVLPRFWQHVHSSTSSFLPDMGPVTLSYVSTSFSVLASELTPCSALLCLLDVEVVPFVLIESLWSNQLQLLICCLKAVTSYITVSHCPVTAYITNSNGRGLFSSHLIKWCLLRARAARSRLSTPTFRSWRSRRPACPPHPPAPLSTC